MYQLSDKQIDFILNDIRSRGVELDSLQEGLLDHVCCIIECELEQNGDFENFYFTTIKKFYRIQLNEIEDETIALLTFKNYYTMKKMMVLSGMISAFLMIIGIWFKIMHYPGAALLLPLGILSGSFVFMPLLFTLKAKEKKSAKEKLVLVSGGFSILLIGIGFLIRLLGTPAISLLPMYLYYLSAVIALGVSLPFYLSSGLKNPGTKTNSIITALLVVMGYAIFFSMTYNPRNAPMYRSLQTYDYVRSQQTLERERRLAGHSTTSSAIVNFEVAHQIDKSCEQVKMGILEIETGHRTIDDGFGKKNILLSDHSINLNRHFYPPLKELRTLVPQYNAALNGKMDKIPLNATFLEQGENQMEYISLISLLNQLTQIQMLVLQNERQLLANK